MKPAIIKCHIVSKAVIFPEADEMPTMIAEAHGHYNENDPSWQDHLLWKIVVRDQDGDILDVMTYGCPFIEIYEYLENCCVDTKNNIYNMLYLNGK